MKFIEIKNKLYIEDAQLLYSNFAGREQTDPNGRIVNNAGNMNFSIVIPEDMVDRMIDDGWNIKIRAPREEGEEVIHYMKVNISYRFSEPEIIMYINGSEKHLHQDTIGNLDEAEIIGLDVCVTHPSEEGRNGYLSEMRVTIEPNPFDLKYQPAED